MYSKPANSGFDSLSREEQFLTRLAIDLSMSTTNLHVGSLLGGDSSQWWFLVNHNVLLASADSPNSSFARVGSEEIIFYVSNSLTPDIKQAREALNSFYENHPHKMSITNEQLKNANYMQGLLTRTLEAKLYLQALKIVNELVTWLDFKREAVKGFDIFNKEKDHIRMLFLKEMNLPVDYFKKLSHIDIKDPIFIMCNKHPVWGSKIKLIEDRQKAFGRLIFSDDDLTNLSLIGSFPFYISSMIMRIIGIERVVALNLDELEETQSFLQHTEKILG